MRYHLQHKVPWALCCLLIVLTFEFMACNCHRGEKSSRWNNVTAPWFNGTLEASPAAGVAKIINKGNAGFRGAGLYHGDLLPGGSIEVLRADAVIQGMDISGRIEIKAPRVTVKNCRIRSSGRFPVRVYPGGSLTIEYTEVIGTPSSDAAIAGDNYTARYCDIHGSADGLWAGSNVIVEYCYIHDCSPMRKGDGIRMLAGGNVLIRYNAIQAAPGSRSAIRIATDEGPVNNVLIDGNSIEGGEYSILSRAGTFVPVSPPTNVRITNNRLGRTFTRALFSIDGSMALRDNVWADTGQPVPARQ